MSFYESIKDYLKCVYRNKFTLTGYIGLASLISMHIGEAYLDVPELGNQWKEIAAFPKIAVLYYSATSLILTMFGTETLKYYHRTKDCIEKFGTVSDRIESLLSKTYCAKVGMNLAIEESCLEDRIQ